MVAEEDSDDLRYIDTKLMPLHVLALAQIVSFLQRGNSVSIQWLLHAWYLIHIDLWRGIGIASDFGAIELSSRRQQPAPDLCLPRGLDSRMLYRGSEEGRGLAKKITAVVNEVLSEEASAGPKSLSQVPQQQPVATLKSATCS